MRPPSGRERQDADLYPKAYLQRFQCELTNAPGAAPPIDTMKAPIPTAGLGVALDIGVKVNKGEMKW